MTDESKESEESESKQEAAARQKAEFRMKLIQGVIFGGLIVALIAVMWAIDSYGEKAAGRTHAPADAADR